MKNFIQRVKNNPCLWNKSHILYRDVVRMDLAWERVARECGMANGREAKCQWKKLRDCHREALRRRSVEHGGQGLRPWKYEEEMKFVLPETENKDSSTSSFVIAYHDRTEKDAESPQPNQEFPITSSELGKNQYTGNTDISEERDFGYFHSQSHPFHNSRDALSNLFECLCQKTRDLPKSLQLRVQREIFDSISRAEDEALSLEMSTNNSPMYGSANVNGRQQSSILRNIKPDLNDMNDGET